MRDYLGNLLEVGDIVIYVLQGYREFRKVTIDRFTECYVILSGAAPKQLPSQLILFKKGEKQC